MTQHSFMKKAAARMRLTREIFEKAVERLLVGLRDDELEALLTESEAPAMNAASPGAKISLKYPPQSRL